MLDYRSITTPPITRWLERLLSSIPLPAFDRLAQLAARVTRTQAALIGLVQDGKVAIISQVGQTEAGGGAPFATLVDALCRQVVASGAALVIDNLHQHPLSEGNDLPIGAAPPAYLGIPIAAPDGVVFGYLCVFNAQPRLWAAEDIANLQDIAGAVQSEIALFASERDRERLQEAESTLRSIMECAPDYIAIVDNENTLRFVNRLSANYLVERVTENIFAYFSEEDQRIVQRSMAQARESGEPAEFEVQTRSETDATGWFSARLGPIRRDGQTVGLVVIGRDTTERRQAEEQLRRSEELYAALVRNFPNGVVVLFDHDLRYTIMDGIDPGWPGHPSEYFRGKTIWEAWEPDVCATIEPIYRGVLAGTAFTMEMAYQDQVYALQCLPVKDERGAIFAGMVISQNITKRKRAETALHHAHQLLTFHVENSPFGVIEWDSDFRIKRWAGQAERIFGWKAEEVVGKHPGEWRFVFEEDAERIAAVMQKLLASEDVPSVTENRNYTKDGAVITCEWHSSILSDAEGNFVSALSLVLDVTARREMEQARDSERALLAERVAERTADLRAANAELSRAARLKDEFLASMSHELRTPLHAMLGMAESLEEEIYGPLNAQQMTALQSVLESGRHLLTLINEILDLARIEAGKVVLQPEKLNVTQICQASMRMIAQMAAEKQLRVTLHIQSPVTTVHADGKRLKQMLVNLLSNAVKFTPRGGAVGLDVHGDQEQGLVHFTVWDTGIGITREDTTRLFKPFVQLDSGLARAYNGTGLGLVLVLRMAELHGGSVSMQSDIGNGSRFTITLPWQLDADHADRPVTHPIALPVASEREPANLTVLLAEDNIINSTMVSDYLQIKGYRVVTASNGNEALAQIYDTRPDIILMDIQMPVMDGLEAIRRIRADTALPAIPIIALTALAMPGDRERCLDAGANDYLMKPVSLKTLAELIDAHCG